MKNLITNFTVHANFQAALDANEEITGKYLYAGLADSERKVTESVLTDDRNFSDLTFYTNPQGRILASYKINRNLSQGEHHLSEITRATSISNGTMYAFDYTENGIELHLAVEKSCDNLRKIYKDFYDGFIDETLVLALMMDLNEEAASAA
tara:strand:+ start:69 stop:521 length:453 start_codon:yes stop_codon:yes gene_type:complete